MNFEHIMFTNQIVLKSGTLGVIGKHMMFEKCYNFQFSNLGHCFCSAVFTQGQMFEKGS